LAAPASAPSSQPVASLDDALAKIEAGENAQAAKLFQSFLSQWPKSAKVQTDEQAVALHGLALAYIRMGEFQKAREPIDRAFAYRKGNRALTLNRIKLDLRQRGFVVRAVKEIDKFPAAGSIDEDTVNLFGAALRKAQANAADKGQVRVLVENYDNYNRRLESTRPGMRHWGSTWMSEAEYQEKVNPPKLMRERDSLRLRQKSARDALDQAGRDLKAAKQQAHLDQTKKNISRSSDGRPDYLVRAQWKYDNAKRELEDVISRLDAIEAKFPSPTWIENLDPEPLDTNLVEKA
jgi:tetratricopeptide (TPR) repeat protein